MAQRGIASAAAPVKTKNTFSTLTSSNLRVNPIKARPSRIKARARATRREIGNHGGPMLKLAARAAKTATSK